MSRNSVRVQSRDRELAKDVFLHRFMRRDDLIKLGYFASVARCNDRISRLVKSGWLRPIPNVNGLSVRQMIYGPGPAAAVYLSQDLDLPLEEVARHCRSEEGPLLIAHCLRILDFRHCLRRATNAAGIDVEEWLSEPECLHEFRIVDRSGDAHVIKPDAYYRLCVNGARHDFFLEMDLGHVALPRFRKKLERYWVYLRSGAFSQVYESPSFSVLTVTTGERRLSHLAALCKHELQHFATTWDRVRSHGPLACRWESQFRAVQLGDILNAARDREAA